MKVLASQKQLENKYKASQTTADDWYRRAKLALEKGDEMLAKEALKRRKDYEVKVKLISYPGNEQSRPHLVITFTELCHLNQSTTKVGGCYFDTLSLHPLLIGYET